MFIKRLQKFLKIPQTGFFDEKTKKHWQNYCHRSPGMVFYAEVIPCAENLPKPFVAQVIGEKKNTQSGNKEKKVKSVKVATVEAEPGQPQATEQQDNNLQSDHSDQVTPTTQYKSNSRKKKLFGKFKKSQQS